jgi:LPXTG-motif cell wall-anchored protein
MAYRQQDLGSWATMIGTVKKQAAASAAVKTAATQSALELAAGSKPTSRSSSTNTMLIVGAGVAVVGLAAYMLIKRRR